MVRLRARHRAGAHGLREEGGELHPRVLDLVVHLDEPGRPARRALPGRARAQRLLLRQLPGRRADVPGAAPEGGRAHGVGARALLFRPEGRLPAGLRRLQDRPWDLGRQHHRQERHQPAAPGDGQGDARRQGQHRRALLRVVPLPRSARPLHEAREHAAVREEGPRQVRRRGAFHRPARGQAARVREPARLGQTHGGYRVRRSRRGVRREAHDPSRLRAVGGARARAADDPGAGDHAAADRHAAQRHRSAADDVRDARRPRRAELPGHEPGARALRERAAAARRHRRPAAHQRQRSAARARLGQLQAHRVRRRLRVRALRRGRRSDRDEGPEAREQSFVRGDEGPLQSQGRDHQGRVPEEHHQAARQRKRQTLLCGAHSLRIRAHLDVFGAQRTGVRFRAENADLDPSPCD